MRGGPSALSEETSLYLSRAAAMLRDGGLGEEERGVLVDQALREVDGQEKAVVEEKQPSRWLEVIVGSATAEQLRGFLHRLLQSVGGGGGVATDVSALPDLCCNPYASHALEALCVRVASLTLPLDDSLPLRDSQGVLIPPLGQLFSTLLTRLGSDLLGMAGAPRASHILRALMLLFGGCAWFSKNAQSAFSLKDGGIVARPIPPAPWMRSLFEKMAESLLVGMEASREDAIQFGCNPASSATLQLFLAICQQGERDGWRSRAVRVLTGLPVSQDEAWNPAGSVLEELAFNNVGSRLIEAVVDRCSEADFRRLWTGFLESRARQLAVDVSGNWILAAALDRAVALSISCTRAVELICTPDLGALLRAHRWGVVIRVVRAVQGEGTGGEEGARMRRRVLALLSHVGEQPAPLLEKLLGSVSEAGAGASRGLVDVAAALHSLGEEGRAVLDRWWDGLDEDEVRQASCCRVWSAVAEAMLRGHASLGSKRKFIRKLRSSWPDLCRDKYGHHVALTALETLELLGEKEVESQLRLSTKKERDYIGRSEWGAKMLRRLADRSEAQHVEGISVAALLGNAEGANGAEKRERTADEGEGEKKKKKKKEKRSRKEKKEEKKLKRKKHLI